MKNYISFAKANCSRLQDVFLFADTIYNNITLNNPTITRADVLAAAKDIGTRLYYEFA
jgi:ABC-type multidrug transport system fused ATPase/permease subunit